MVSDVRTLAGVMSANSLGCDVHGLTVRDVMSADGLWCAVFDRLTVLCESVKVSCKGAKV